MQKFIDEHQRAEMDKMRQWDRMNYYLGIYIGRAVNATKANPYPSRPLLEEGPIEMTDDDMEAVARRLNKKFGGEVN